MHLHPNGRAAADPDAGTGPDAGAIADTGAATLDDVAALLRGIRAELRAGKGELLTAEEAAAYLGVGRTKFFELVSAVGVLKPVKLPNAGKMWRRADLAAFVAELEQVRG